MRLKARNGRNGPVFEYHEGSRKTCDSELPKHKHHATSRAGWKWSQEMVRRETQERHKHHETQSELAGKPSTAVTSQITFGQVWCISLTHPSFIQQDFTLCLCSSICNLLYMLRIYTRDSLHLSINWSHELTVRGGLFAENGAPILRKKICLV